MITVEFLDLLVRPVTLMQPLTDITVCEGDIAQLEVRFSQENVEGTWLKNGQAISASERVHIVIDKQVHKLLLENVSTEDAASYSFVVPAQDISTSGKLSVQSKTRDWHQIQATLNSYLQYTEHLCLGLHCVCPLSFQLLTLWCR